MRKAEQEKIVALVTGGFPIFSPACVAVMGHFGLQFAPWVWAAYGITCALCLLICAGLSLHLLFRFLRQNRWRRITSFAVVSAATLIPSALLAAAWHWGVTKAQPAQTARNDNSQLSRAFAILTQKFSDTVSAPRQTVADSWGRYNRQVVSPDVERGPLLTLAAPVNSFGVPLDYRTNRSVRSMDIGFTDSAFPWGNEGKQMFFNIRNVGPGAVRDVRVQWRLLINGLPELVRSSKAFGDCLKSASVRMITLQCALPNGYQGTTYQTSLSGLATSDFIPEGGVAQANVPFYVETALQVYALSVAQEEYVDWDSQPGSMPIEHALPPLQVNLTYYGPNTHQYEKRYLVIGRMSFTNGRRTLVNGQWTLPSVHDEISSIIDDLAIRGDMAPPLPVPSNRRK